MSRFESMWLQASALPGLADEIVVNLQDASRSFRVLQWVLPSGGA